MNYKQSITAIFESEKQVYKKYADTGKMPRKTIDTIYSYMRGEHIAKGTFTKFIDIYLDWVVFNYYNLHMSDPNKYKLELEGYGNNTLDELNKAANFHEFLAKRKIVKGTPIYKKYNKQIDWVGQMKDILHQHAIKQTATNIGGNYNKVYNKDGFEIFECIDQESVIKIGASANWCIRRDEKYWNEYNAEGKRFFVIVDHHRGKKRPNGADDLYRKICLQLDSVGGVTIWDYNDNDMELNDWIKSIYDLAPEDAILELRMFCEDGLEHFDSDYTDDGMVLLEQVSVFYKNLIHNMNDVKNKFEDIKAEKYETEKEEKLIDELVLPIPDDLLLEWWRDIGFSGDVKINGAIEDYIFVGNPTMFENLPNPTKELEQRQRLNYGIV
jgi:hypothetical protein